MLELEQQTVLPRRKRQSEGAQARLNALEERADFEEEPAEAWIWARTFYDLLRNLAFHTQSNRGNEEYKPR